MLSEQRQRELAEYCRVEEADPLLPLLYDAAEGYLGRAGVTRPEGDPKAEAQYDLAVNYLVLDGYDHRDTSFGGFAMDNPAFRRLINQLKFCQNRSRR